MITIFRFLSVFLFTQICEIYIMGGFDHQTILSKSTSVVIGFLFGIGLVAAIESK